VGLAQLKRGLLSRSCPSSSNDKPPVLYEFTLVEENPSVVRSVTANAYEVSDDDAADFAAYVAELSLQDTGLMNPATWIRENTSLGVGYFAGGKELRLYGTEGARTLEITATAVL
jgi:hypothetical protein